MNKNKANKTKLYLGVLILLVVVVLGVLLLRGTFSQHPSGTQALNEVVANGENSSTSTQSAENVTITDTRVGTGPEVQNGDTVVVNFIGTLDDGTEFVSTYHPNSVQDPLTFVVGAGQVIKGFELGLLGMQVAGVREITVPPELGYGAQGMGQIPPNATLHFIVNLFSISSGTPPHCLASEAGCSSPPVVSGAPSEPND